MWIDVVMTFRDERDQFFAGEKRFVVDEERARRFISNGWAAEPGKAPIDVNPADVKLQIHGSAHKVKDSNG